MVNPEMPDEWTVSLGEATEILADRYDISREDAGRVRARAATSSPHAAWEAGRLRGQRRPGARTPISSATRRSAPTRTRREARQAQAGVPQGRTVTAGNSSPLNDGAARADHRRRGRGASGSAASRSRGSSRAACTASIPTSSASRPVEAANKALRRPASAGATSKAVELNEAFAAQSLACVRRVAGARPGDRQRQRRRDRDRPPARLLRRAHPRRAGVGSCDARAAATASPRICIGVGQGLAVVLEA